MCLADVALDLLYQLVVATCAHNLATFAVDHLRHGSSSRVKRKAAHLRSFRRDGCPNLGGTLATRIHLCGAVTATIDGERVESALAGRQGRLLFAYLVSHRLRASSRDELIDA